MAPGAFLSVFLLAWGARAADPPCKHQPVVAKLPKGASDHFFAEDRDSPYKYSEVRFAHEKLTLKDAGVGIEHFGCEAWEGGERRRYSFAFKLPGDGPPREDSAHWLKKASELLKALGVCSTRPEFPRSWCTQLRLGMAMKPEYMSGGKPEDEGYAVSFGFEPDGGEEVLRVLVDRRPDRTLLRVANLLIRRKPGE